MVLHELSVSKPPEPVGELEQIGLREAWAQSCCYVSCHHSLITYTPVLNVKWQQK